MPVHRCGSSALCLHDIDSSKHLDGSGDFEYVEVDPTGRYGRYKEVLGKGAFKTVYRAFDQEEGIEVAWNQIQLQDVLQTSQDVDRLYSEVHLLKTLKHKNIIKFYHSWVDKKANTVNFITEIFTSGTLRQYRKRHKHIDIKAVKNWSRQILRGLLYLHSHDPPIIHRDLKCDNIFINGNQGEVKIGDLGLAKILQHAQPARSVIGTPEFMAPELYEEEYTELVDIYSFGMCLLELATSDYPYSECTNAAQIYKKVSSGKKPEALKKVKDLGLCQFIEKCLATASQRLPARELLMDPFLQCEDGLGDINRTTQKANGVDQSIVHSEEPHGKSATVHISYKLKETISTLLNDSGDYLASSLMDLKCGQGADEADILTLSKATLSNSMKDDRARQVDFRVHGKRREDDNVYLKLRIADAEGQVRNIHFPFDVEIDTALCVASEMVAELDLTDQDVTKIAEMIDAAILALVPEWKPGVAIDEAYNDNEAQDDSNSVCREELISTATAQISLLSGDLCEDEASPCSPTRSDSRPFCILKTEGAMHGRFEEVVYQCHNSEFPVDYMTVSSISTDFLSREAHWGLSESSSSSFASVASICESDMHVRVTDGSLFNCLTDCRALVSSEGASTSLQLEGTKRGLDVTDTAHEMWERSVQAHAPHAPHAAFHTGSLLASISHKSLLEACPSVPGYQNLQHSASGPLLFKPPWGWEENCDEYVMKELTEISIKHEQEIQDLRRKHEEALSQLRDRWRQRSRAFKINQKCECPLRSEDATLMNDKSALAYDAVEHDECALSSEQATARKMNNYIEHGLLKLARNGTSPSRVLQNSGSFYRSVWSPDDSPSIWQ